MTETPHDYDDTVKVKLDGPLAVRGRRPVSITTEQFTLAAGTPQRILGRNPQRCRAVITVSADTMIGPDRNAATSGLLITTTSNPLELHSSDEVWATGTGTVYVLAEHYDGS